MKSKASYFAYSLLTIANSLFLIVFFVKGILAIV